jgi:hypothetical protein
VMELNWSMGRYVPLKVLQTYRSYDRTYRTYKTYMVVLRTLS